MNILYLFQNYKYFKIRFYIDLYFKLTWKDKPFATWHFQNKLFNFHDCIFAQLYQSFNDQNTFHISKLYIFKIEDSLYGWDSSK